MDSLENVFLFLDYLTDTQRKRHVVGGVLMSVSLFFGGLACPISVFAQSIP